LRYDGTKLSALIILENARKKLPIVLDLKNKIPWRTNAGKELNNHIHELINPKRDLDDKLGKLIEEADDDDKVKILEAEQKQLKDALSRLDDERKKLGNPINWEQAKKDNEALEGVIKEQRDSAAKDWKAEYNSVLNEKNALQTKLNSSLSFSVPIWSTITWVGYHPFLPSNNGELFHTNGLRFTVPGTSQEAYMVRTSAGGFGCDLRFTLPLDMSG